MREPPDLDDVVAASKRIVGVASRTPLVEAPALSKRFRRRVFLKLECYQPIRVFKIRGAYNKVSQVKSDSIVAASSGNHGIAVAYSARLTGKRCTVVVPKTAVEEKVEMISELGATIVKHGTFSHERESKALEIAESTGAAFVPPYDDLDVIAGQGTAGLEVVEQLEEFDSMIVPVGGGGLISGISVAVKACRPSVRIFGVEPTGAAKLAASLKSGRRVILESPKSIADGLVPNSIGELAFEVCKKNVAGTFQVSDEMILEGMRVLAHEAHVIAEPSGAAPVAALLQAEKVGRLGRRVVLLISGGNVSLELTRRILWKAPRRSPGSDLSAIFERSTTQAQPKSEEKD